MGSEIEFVAVTLAVGFLCALPGVVVGRSLAAKGIVQDYKIKPIVLTIFVLLVGRLLIPQVPLIALAIFGILFSTAGVYRSDWWSTHRKGRWWWRQQGESENPIVISIGVIILSLGILATIWLITK